LIKRLIEDVSNELRLGLFRGMGELYGSEYWTYLLPKRVGQARALELAHADGTASESFLKL
jgi:hypothetical protein